ncbi:MAG: NADH-quinone oxidoreductase subunit NuoK [Candidatus Parvarchaeota archaeon]|nr:NADH-quinone oxidoreductase subunit NuoK [Candidatus Parvarchaeota archaeon]
MVAYIDFVVLSSILFAIAIFGIISRRNGITFVVSAEIIINAAMINFVGASSAFNSYSGASYALITLVIAVLETVVLLGMLIIFSRKTGSVSFSKMKEFKG